MLRSSLLRSPLLILFLPTLALAQGPLTPPGPPGASQRTLGQIEPRTPVESLSGDASAKYVISAPGSYYLSAGNLTGTGSLAGIAIAADGVTLDLNGFALIGGASSTRGVELRGALQNVVIRNGTIRSWLNAGVGIVSAVPVSVTVEGISVAGIAEGPGIVLADFNGSSAGLRVERCTVANTKGAGIHLGKGGSAHGCNVTGVQGDASMALGIAAGLVVSSSAASITAADGSSAYGILAVSAHASSVSNIAALGNGSTSGIQADNVTNCSATAISQVGSGVSQGIQAGTISHCFVSQVGNANSTSIQYGISATGTVTASQVLSIGGGGSAFVVGLQTDVAANCEVSSVGGGGTVQGISARLVENCVVSAVNTTGSGSAVTGIQAERAASCRVTNLSSFSSLPLVAFSISRQATGCGASTLTNAGAGSVVGIELAAGSAAEHCQVTLSTTGTGIHSSAIASVRQSSVTGVNSVVGIDLQATGCQIDGNKVNGCNVGIRTIGNSLVVRNHVTATTTRFSVPASAQMGPIVNAGGPIASTSPWANFTD